MAHLRSHSCCVGLLGDLCPTAEHGEESQESWRARGCPVACSSRHRCCQPPSYCLVAMWCHAGRTTTRGHWERTGCSRLSHWPEGHFGHVGGSQAWGNLTVKNCPGSNAHRTAAETRQVPGGVCASPVTPATRLRVHPGTSRPSSTLPSRGELCERGQVSQPSWAQ